MASLVWVGWLFVLGPYSGGEGHVAYRPEVAAPSGLALSHHDILWEEGPGGFGRQIVLRFIAPGIGPGGLTLDAVTGDMEAACTGLGRAVLAAAGTEVDSVLVVFMDRPVPRGRPDGDAAMYIAAFTIENDSCIWETL